jgi:hypothetical protein
LWREPVAAPSIVERSIMELCIVDGASSSAIYC